MGTDRSRLAKRRAVVVSMALLIALAHIVDIRSRLQGVWFNLYPSYFSDVVLPFAFYFLLVQVEGPKGPLLRHWAAKAAVAFVTPALAETCQGFGIPVLGATFDPLDYLMYALGAGLAALVDVQVFSRMFSFWRWEGSD
ncbi:MAG: hypothetical protein GX605_02130 [Chloroflexi bacterium]|nr:hypothetical protein [Chloroflexota bacterium]